MKPKHRNKRLASLAIGGVVLVTGVALLGSALNANRQFFYVPSAVAADGFEPRTDSIRVGGLVQPGSVETLPELRTEFTIVDFEAPDSAPLKVAYTGILPDLFKEDSGVVVTGRVDDGVLEASELLAKHDENYMPKLD